VPLEAGASGVAVASATVATADGWTLLKGSGKRVVGSLASRGGRDPSLLPGAPPIGPVADGPPVRDEPTRQAEAPVYHTVRRGENFWTISKLYYDSSRYYKALHAANRRQVPDINELYVGTVIRIPPPEDLDRALILPVTAASVAASTPRRTQETSDPGTSSRPRRPVASGDDLEVPATTRPPAARPRPVEPDPQPQEAAAGPSYKIKTYDTLRSIAGRTLGDSKRYLEIYELNRDLLADPRDPLPPGESLVLPRDAVVGRR
jgi:nucleoid-associated protein YgaU